MRRQNPTRDVERGRDGNARALPIGDIVELDLLRLFKALKAGFIWILLTAALFIFLAAFYTDRYMTSKYRSTGNLYVMDASNPVVNMSDIEVGASLTNDYKKVVTTWEVLEQTIKNLGLKHSIDELRSMIAIHNPSNTRIMEISVESESAKEAATIANELMAVVNEYIPRVIESVKPNILSRALVPSRPFTPNMFTNMTIGGFAGALLGLFAVFIHFLLDDRIKSADDIRRYIGTPLLAAIPRPMERSRRDKQE